MRRRASTLPSGLAVESRVLDMPRMRINLRGARMKETAIEEWVVVSSRTGKCSDGFPVGQILCRHGDSESIIKEYGINEPVVTKYIDHKAEEWIGLT